MINTPPKLEVKNITRPFLADLLLIIGLFLLCASLASMLALISIGLYYGVLNKMQVAQFMQIDNISRHPQGWYILLYMQFVSSIGTLVLSSWLYIRVFNPKFSLNTNAIRIKDFPLVLMLVVAMMPFTLWISLWNMGIDLPNALTLFEKWAKAKELQMKEFTDFMTHFANLWQLLLGIFVIAVLPAIGEELWFRGLFQNILMKRFNPHLAIWLAGAIFSAIHFQFYGFFPRWFLGVMFGYLYYWTKNIWIPILAHFLNNGITLIFIYLYQKQLLQTDFYQPREVPIYLVLLSIVLVSIGLYAIKKAKRKALDRVI